MLLTGLCLAVAVPLEELTQSYLEEVFRTPEDYEEGHEFVPPSEHSFDMFDWRLCQVSVTMKHHHSLKDILYV